MIKDDIVKRLRDHVNNRGGPSIANGAWEMMLEAADEIVYLRGSPKSEPTSAFKIIADQFGMKTIPSEALAAIESGEFTELPPLGDSRRHPHR